MKQTMAATPPPQKRRWRILGPISPAHVELQLMGLAFAAGMIDSITFPAFGIFVSNQTGNMVFLALGAASIENMPLVIDIPHTVMSLGMFCMGAFVNGQLGLLIGPFRREWLLTTNSLQSLLVLGCALVVFFIPVATKNYWNLFIISALSFASGAQVAMARGLRVPEIPTSMATAAFVDVLVDPLLFHRHNIPRNRRVGFLILFFLGALVGAFMYRFIGLYVGFLVAACTKFAVGSTFFFNRSIREEYISPS